MVLSLCIHFVTLLIFSTLSVVSHRPQYRDNARVKLGQDYSSVGLHYLLLPEPIRFLTDKLVSVNTQVPEVDNVVQISTNELLPALNEVFTLDVFAISYVSVAIRSFVHHFYPAYRQPILDYAEKVASGDLERRHETARAHHGSNGRGNADQALDGGIRNPVQRGGNDLP